MIRLRPFKISDCVHLIDWVNDEKTFTMWCANKFTYPLNIEQLVEYKHKYDNEEDGWSFTALDEHGSQIGHLLMRMANYEKESVHFGFIIVDPSHRGSGYGKEMVSLAAKYAFEILKVKKITLGVFSNNPAAHQCYKAVGFNDVKYHEKIFSYKEEKWGLYDMEIDI